MSRNQTGGEWTPLQHPGSSSTSTTGLFAAGGNEMKALVSNLLGPENLSSASSVAKARLNELYQQTRSGDWSLRLLGLISGVALVVASLLEVLVHFFTLHWIRVLIDLFLMATGLVLLVLESRQLNLPELVLSNLYAYALFLKFVWGRGLLLIVAGVLQMGQGGGIVAWIVGAFVLLAGILHVVVGRSASHKLGELRAALSEQTLHGKFHEANVSGTGSLSSDEFASLCASLGVPLRRGEVEAAFLHVGQDSTAIAFDRFRSWWITSSSSG
jgi:COPI associated protein